MKYLFFRALLFYFVLFFNLLYFQSTWKSFLITNIECLGFLKCVRIGSHGIPFKKKKISKNSDIGDFYQRILINWYYLLCLLSSTVFRNSIVFFLLLEYNSLFYYSWFFIHNTLCVTVITAALGIFLVQRLLRWGSLLTELKWKLCKFPSIRFLIPNNSFCYQEISHKGPRWKGTNGLYC